MGSCYTKDRKASVGAVRYKICSFSGTHWSAARESIRQNRLKLIHQEASPLRYGNIVSIEGIFLARGDSGIRWSHNSIFPVLLSKGSTEMYSRHIS